MIGIIGFGRFGKLTAGYLAEDFDVFVFNRTDKSSEIKKIGAHEASLSTVCQQNTLILCVPISTLKHILKEIAPIVKKGCLVVDACSVKKYPSQWMKDLLPETVSILATHPMFGPDSVSHSLKGRKIFLSPIRVGMKRYRRLKSYLSRKGLIIIESTPEDHDKQMAISLALTHFIGRALSEFGAVQLNMDTEGYQRLLTILDVVEHDTWQLFYDMHRYNPYAEKQRAAFIQAMKKINDRL